MTTKLSPTLSFGPLGAKNVGSGTFTLRVTTDSSGTRSFHSSDNNIVSVAGSSATPVAAGTATITVNQAETATHLAASATATQLVTVPDDVDIDQSSANETGSGGQRVVFDQGGHAGQKYIRLEVPGYRGSNSTYPLSYIQLGKARSESSLKRAGDDLLKAVDLDRSTQLFFRDDYRVDKGYNHPQAVYLRDDGVATSTATGNPKAFVKARTAELLTRGGWREHTDGNRVTTTRGDRIEVIGGNYKMVVLGRRWQRTGDSATYTKHGWGESYWESSGGHNKDGTNTPGEVVNIQWHHDSAANTDEWRVVDETVKGNVIGIYQGNQYETYKCRLIKSTIGGPSTSTAIVDNPVGTVQHQNPDQGWLLGGTVNWQKPSVSEYVKAKAITGTTEVFADGSGDGSISSEEWIGTKTAKTQVDGTWTSNTKAEVVIDQKGSVTSPIAKFSENLHTSSSLKSQEFFVVNIELAFGGLLETNHGQGFALKVGAVAEVSASASATCWLNCYKIGVFIGRKTTLELGNKLNIDAALKLQYKLKYDKIGLSKNRASLIDMATKVKEETATAGSMRPSLFKFWL